MQLRMVRICVLLGLVFLFEGCDQLANHTEVTVTRVNDGDSFEITYINGDEARVRIHGIDSPELNQAYGRQVRILLKDLIEGKAVRLVVLDKDRYGRLLCDVYLEEQNIAHYLLENGGAWHYKKYSNDRTYSRLEKAARKDRVGLWKDKYPVPPWTYREQNRR